MKQHLMEAIRDIDLLFKSYRIYFPQYPYIFSYTRNIEVNAIRSFRDLFERKAECMSYIYIEIIWSAR